MSTSNSLILGSGANVGIGTSSPTDKLTVVGTGSFQNLKILSGASNGYVLTSDANGLATWQSLSGSSVASVFGRSGAIVSASGDYTAGQVTNVAAGDIAATNVQAAINELDTEKEPTINPA